MINNQKILLLLFKEKRVCIFISSLCLLLGIWHLYKLPKEYTAVGKIMPEVNHRPDDDVLLIHLKTTSLSPPILLDVTTPELYVDIGNSSKHFLYLLNQNIHLERGESRSFRVFCQQTLFAQRRIGVTKHNILDDNTLIFLLREKIKISFNKWSKVVSVSTTLSDPAIAAQISNLSMRFITNEILLHRIAKPLEMQQFWEKELQNLQENKKYNYSPDLEQSVLASLIASKASVQKNTPILQTLESPRTPTTADDNSKKIYPILINSIIIGILLSITFILVRYKKEIFSRNGAARCHRK